ncbi:putative NAD/FAD-dependent oxidoreductase [Rivularia sp. PCC 7116]|uniref:NAD(P)/FAD-dependent oxidoreductase n=1 Tax=Rivularia sp. PCC 7116 TaxID=373994 RepID=UPI00029F1F9D|nr:FAD-dependent oxidoreductase [Rivularia sp. PCC 7116]AFY53440.1 putative NAD/FAD-dependent oxidoreductase [Rivularia sp. PCC 7116]
MTDITVIGAGIAGLVCAQQLTQVGYSVKIIDKSRGVGGRVATRRLFETKADHGACYLKPKGEFSQRLVTLLSQKGDLEVWTDTLHVQENSSSLTANLQSSLPYTAPEGMNVIAKFLAQGLQINRGERVKKIDLNFQNQWHLTSQTNQEFTASSLVVAIPAPQAVMILESFAQNLLDNNFLEKLRGVEYYPAITVMAGYTESSAQPEWKAITFTQNSVLGWIGLDSSKRKNPTQPHFVIHSSADFAHKNFESEDLEQVGREILHNAASGVNLPWLNNPQWMQVHRWRYAFPKTPLQQTCLPAETSLPLVCCGDWCGGNLIESAILSGIAAAEHINCKLQQRELPGINFFDAL